MLIEDSDKILDMQCIIEIKTDYPVLTLSQELNVSIPGISMVSRDMVEMFLFVPKNRDDSRDMHIFLERFKALDLGAMWAIRASSIDYPPVENLRLLTQLPSVVFDGFILSKGSLRLFARFNNKYSSLVSKALMNGSKVQKGMIPIYLGKSRGRFSFLREINDLMNLDYISIASFPPDYEKTEERNPVPPSWIREVKYISESGIDAVYHIRPQGYPSMDQSPTAPVYYEARTVNPVLEMISSVVASIPIPTYSAVQSFDGTLFKMDFAVPTDYVSRFLKIIADAHSRFPDWRISISGILPLPDILKNSQ